MKLLAFLAAAAIAMPAIAATPPAALSYSDKLAKLDPLRRSAVLRRAVLDGGERCKRVTASTRQGMWKNLVMWVARCEPGGDYGIFIGPDGSVQVRPCADMPKVKLPKCRVPQAG